MTFGKGLRSAEDTISIHATLAGGDCLPLAAHCVKSRCFYPRHPRVWRLAADNDKRAPGDVSTHATLAGGDLGQGDPRL